MPWNFLTKFGKDYASCLSACASLWIAIGRQKKISYSMMERLITMAVIGMEENDDNKDLVYVKGF